MGQFVWVYTYWLEYQFLYGIWKKSITERRPKRVVGHRGSDRYESPCLIPQRDVGPFDNSGNLRQKLLDVARRAMATKDYLLRTREEKEDN